MTKNFFQCVVNINVCHLLFFKWVNYVALHLLHFIGHNIFRESVKTVGFSWANLKISCQLTIRAKKKSILFIASNRIESNRLYGRRAWKSPNKTNQINHNCVCVCVCELRIIKERRHVYRCGNTLVIYVHLLHSLTRKMFNVGCQFICTRYLCFLYRSQEERKDPFFWIGIIKNNNISKE